MAFKNARKYFITAKADTDVFTLLSQHLDEGALKALESGGVWLEKKRITNAAQSVLKGQTLIVYISATQHKTYRFSPSQIVSETDDWMVVDKPAGITTVADRSHTQNNLSYGVGQYYKSLGNAYVPVAITRLDFMVNGLVLFPKHKQAEKDLFKLMAERKIGKYYVARLEKIDKPARCLRVQDALTFRDKAYIETDGKRAHSLFILRDVSETIVTYGVIIFTGRRHQIRIHASRYLAPILGDSLYGGKVELPGQALGLTAFGYNFFWKGKRYRIRKNKNHAI